MVDDSMGSWAQRVFAITLVVEDLDAAREFYGRAFGLAEHYFSGDSAVFRFGDLLINLLEATRARGCWTRCQWRHRSREYGCS